MDSTKPKSLVAKSNTLIPEFLKLGHQEKRFLSYCIRELNPKHEKELGRFKVNIGQVAEVFGLPKTHTYPRIRQAATAINSRPIFRIEGKTHKMDFWFSWLDWEPETGEIEIQFNERLVPFLLDLHREYIQYPLDMVAQFSNNAWSVYEILKQWAPVGGKKFEVDELKTLLNIVGKYPKWYDLRKYIIDPALVEINEKSDITAEYVPYKKGRSVIGVKFTIYPKKPGEADVIDIDSASKKLYKELLALPIPPETAERYIRDAERLNATQHLLDKLPLINERAAGKSNRLSYLQGVINKELQQPPLPFGAQDGKAALEKKSTAALEQLAACGNKVAEKILKERGPDR